MTARLAFQELPAPVQPLRYETDDMARVRQHLESVGFNNEEIDVFMHGYNVITNSKRRLGIR